MLESDLAILAFSSFYLATWCLAVKTRTRLTQAAEAKVDLSVPWAALVRLLIRYLPPLRWLLRGQPRSQSTSGLRVAHSGAAVPPLPRRSN